MRRIPRGGACRVSTLALLCAVCLSCKKTPAPSGDGGAAASTAGDLTPEQASQVLAHVGDRTITLGDFASTIERMDQFDRVRYQAPERRKELLKEMIDTMLLGDEARERHYDQDLTTRQEIRQIERESLLRKANEGSPSPAEIPSAQVKAYYETHSAGFHDPERRRVGAIVVASASVATGIIATLQAGGGASHWGELVRARSLDARAKSNGPPDLAGDLGFVSPPGDPQGANPLVPEEVRAAVFTLSNVGDVAPTPVAAGGRFYVIKLSSRTDAHDRTLQDAERSIRVRLAQEGVHAKQEALIDDLRQRFPVKIDEAALATVRVDLTPVDAGVDAH